MTLRCPDCGQKSEEISVKQPYCPDCLDLNKPVKFKASDLLDDPDDLDDLDDDDEYE